MVSLVITSSTILIVTFGLGIGIGYHFGQRHRKKSISQ